MFFRMVKKLHEQSTEEYVFMFAHDLNVSHLTQAGSKILGTFEWVIFLMQLRKCSSI